MATNAEHQARLRERRAAAGIVQVTVWAPTEAAASIKEAAERMCGNRDLILDGLRHRRTGRWLGFKQKLAAA
jgi:hypothetical protein